MKIRDFDIGDSLAELTRVHSSAFDKLRKQFERFDRIAELSGLRDSQFTTAIEKATAAQESLLGPARRIAEQHTDMLASVRLPKIPDLESPLADALVESARVAEQIRESVIGPSERMAERLWDFRSPVMDSYSMTAEAIEAMQTSVLAQSQRMADQLATTWPAFDIPSFEPPWSPEPPFLDAIEPVQPRVTAAAEVLGRVNDEFERRKADVAGTDNQVQIKVTPPDGRPILAMTMTADGENMIVIDGYNMEPLADSGSLEKRTVTVGATAFQIEFFTIELPSPKPDLRIVE